MSVNTSGTYTLEAINANGCEAKDTIAVIVSGQAPIAAFTATDACFGTALAFVDESAPIGSDFIVLWNWNMGNGVVLSGQNQNYVYPAPGIFAVQLYVESVGGCGAFHWDTLEIFANPTAAFSTSGHCSGQEVEFSSNSSAGGAPIISHNWNFGLLPPENPLNYSTDLIAYCNYATAGNYAVTLLVTDLNSCSSTISSELVMDPSPNALFQVNDACIGAVVPFIDQSTAPVFSTYFWDFGNNNTSVLTNPNMSYYTPGNYFVNLVITSPAGCVGSVIEELIIRPNPVSEMFVGGNLGQGIAYCKGTYTQASAIYSVDGGIIDSVYWIFDQTDTLFGSDVQYVFNTLEQHQVVLNTISNYGCKTSISDFIEVSKELNADFTAGTGVIAAGAPLKFLNTTVSNSDTVLFLWSFGDNTTPSNLVSPEHTYGEIYIDSTVKVFLLALNPEGCVDTAYYTIVVERAKIDLELSYLFIEKNNDWHTIAVQLTNRGTAPLKKIDLNLETEKGFLFQETWTGELRPLEDTIYLLNAHPISSNSNQNSDESYICMSAVGYDLFLDEETILWNNYLCKNIEGDNVILKPVHPNPVEGDLAVEIIVTIDSEVTLQLFDTFGRAVRTVLPKQILAEGQYTFTVSTDYLSSGTYFLRMVSNDSSVMQKISFQ